MTAPALVTQWTIGLGGAVFAALLLAACVTDVRARRIPNTLVLVILAGGLAYSFILSPTLMTPVRALGCLLLGFVLWIPFYALRMLGAGDVKLFAAAATWLAPAAVVQAALLSALFGGVLGLLWFVRAHGFGFSIVRLSHAMRQPKVLREPLPVDASRSRLPYGVAMTLGLLVAAVRLYLPTLSR